MKNYMEFIDEGTKIYYKSNDDGKFVISNKNDKEAKCYIANQKSFITGYNIKGDFIYVKYADNKEFKYPNDPDFIQIINNYIEIQLLLLSYLYQNDLIPSPKDRKKFFIQATAIISLGALIANTNAYQTMHKTFSVYQELPSFLIMDFLIASLIIIPQISNNLYRKEIKKFISKLDLYYTNQALIDRYLNKKGNDSIKAVESMEMSKLVKIIHKSKNDLHNLN